MPVDTTQQQDEPKIDKEAQADVLHKIRYNHLGYTLKGISGLLDITDKHLRNLLHGNLILNPVMYDRIAVITSVHWHSPVSLTDSGNDVVRIARYALQHTYTINDLKSLCIHLSFIANQNFARDYGLLHIYALANFAIFKLDLKNIVKNNAMNAHRQFLRTAIINWENAYRRANDVNGTHPLVSKLFQLNRMSAEIYDNYYYENQGALYPNDEYYKKLHDYTNGCFQLNNPQAAIAAIHTIINMLEQSALKNDQNTITEDFTLLTTAIDESKITIKDQREILLPELLNIDGADALKNNPTFQNWKHKIKQR
ncbi:hypothetical protein CCP3SC5AM1_1080009 [Gammaproteobacteria bacterium]